MGRFIKRMKDINPDPLLIVQLTHSGEISGGGAYSVLNNGKNTLKAVQPEWNSMLHWGNYNIEHGYCDSCAELLDQQENGG